MKQFIPVLIFFALFQTASAQVNNSSISFKNGFFGWQFKQGEEKLKPGQVSDILKTNPEASALFSKGRTNYTIATIIGSIGGGLFGYTVGTSLGGGKTNWTVGGIGAGLVVASLPLSIISTGQVRKAVLLYNEGLKTGSFKKTELQLNFTGSGLGLVYRF